MLFRSCSIRRCADGTIAAQCFGCHATGDTLDIIAAVRGLDRRRDFRRVLEEAAALAGVDLEEREPRRRRRLASPTAVAVLMDQAAHTYRLGRAVLPREAIEFASAPIISEALSILSDVDEAEAARVAEMQAETDVANGVWDLLSAAADLRARRAWEASCPS